MHKFKIEEKLAKVMIKLSKKDKHRYEVIIKKIKEIIKSENIEHYKNLRKPLQHLKRVHINSHFVLVFKYEKERDIIKFYYLDHHDNIYK